MSVSILKIIQSPDAPKAIGPYSQAVQVGNTVYFSGQIPLCPLKMTIVEGDFRARVHQVFKNLGAVAVAAGGQYADFAKITIFLTDLSNFEVVNEVMKEYFHEPYPARSTIQVAALPKQTDIEIEAIMILKDA